MFALDTNTLIYFFKGMGDVAEHLLATAPAHIAIPTIVLYEIETGIAKYSHPQRRKDQLAQLLDVITVLPFDRAAAIQAASIRAQLEAVGTPIGPLDAVIAGTTLAHNATLVTHNAREFSRVPRLAIVDWYD
jgi:tRNA(fMet)-specific endonuclease VapC